MKFPDWFIRNAIASGTIVPPPTDLSRRRPWTPLGRAILFINLAALCVAGFLYGWLIK